MTNQNRRDVQTYQRSAFQWLKLARGAKNEEERKHLLAIADEWLQLAHDAFAQEEALLPGRMH